MPEDIAPRDDFSPRLRRSEAHSAYATDRVRLAFGRRADGRVVHVQEVERGIRCECSCPACSEELIARKGDRLAWHFAHASGSDCRDALAAGISAFLAQLLNDGLRLTLPSVEWRWGNSMNRRQTTPIELQSAVARKGSSGVWEVRASAGSKTLTVSVILPGAAERATAPSSASMSHLVIDLTSCLNSDEAEGGGAEEAGLTSMLLREAPRAWAWNASSERKRQREIEERLGGRLAAYERLFKSGKATACPLSDSPACELLDTPRIRGEELLGPSPSAWRKEILVGVVLDAIKPGFPVEPARHGFGDRKIIRTLARERMVREPELVRPIGKDDLIELQALAPEIRRPIDIVGDYLRQLHALGYLAARPGLPGLHRDDLVEPELAAHGSDWIATPALMEAASSLFD